MENDFYLTIEQIMKKHNIKDSRHLESRLCFLEKDIEARKKEYKELSNSLLKILIKLNEYESIEDELGMPISLFFKSLKANKVYVKEYGDYFETDLYFLNGDDVSKWGFDADGYGEDIVLYFKDYGKTWALTEGELL